ncbi:MAG: hydroxymethylglutaryl-CoA synthase, partial [Halobacteria archaeon]|nr:hydroxymethylglutaryl-CoA synthase [Halobacteria archaeon]
VGADVSQGEPGDSLEYSAAAGGAGFVLGTENVLAEVEGTASYTTDTPDFWRREGERYPQHGERFTGKPAYFKHTTEASRSLMEELGTQADDYDYAVFHQPNGKFPVAVAEKLGFGEEEYGTGLLAPTIGNTYSGASLLGFAAVLDDAEPGDRVFVASFGSGAGSDAFSFRVTERIDDVDATGIAEAADDEGGRRNLDYAEYAKRKGKIRRD